MKCRNCNCPLSDDTVVPEGFSAVHAIVYQGRISTYCAECFNDEEVIVRSYGGIRAPICDADYTVFYDGETEHYLHNGRVYLDGSTPVNSFYCEFCDNNFYGQACITADTDQYACYHCANEHLHYDGDEWFRHPEDHDDEERQPNGCVTYPGNETERFLAKPMIGIEFEHAPVRYKGNDTHENMLYSEVRKYAMPDTGNRMTDMFCVHHDGSICHMSGYSAQEIVSMPASGHMIDHIIDAFYDPFKRGDFTPGPEHHSCGFHIHVSSKTVNTLRRLSDSGQVSGAWRANNRLVLGAMDTICKEFVSSSRRACSYCNGTPKLRDKSMSINGSFILSEVYGAGGYPSIAIRTIGTLEYRLWPSSNSSKYTKARAELSQKLTVYYDSIMMNEDGTKIDFNASKADKLKALSDMCRGGARRGLVHELAVLLGLSSETEKSLTRLSERFSPFSHQKTYFKFTEVQLACLGAERSEASIDYIRPTDLNTLRTTGDTTISGTDKHGDEQTYISWKSGIKCYPAETTGDQKEIVMKLAKGEE